MSYGAAPYDLDQWEIDIEMADRRVRKENDVRLRMELAKEYGVPPEFMDLAVRIWWAGKED
jgi:hypothetical protein